LNKLNDHLVKQSIADPKAVGFNNPLVISNVIPLADLVPTLSSSPCSQKSGNSLHPLVTTPPSTLSPSLNSMTATDTKEEKFPDIMRAFPLGSPNVRITNIPPSNKSRVNHVSKSEVVLQDLISSRRLQRQNALHSSLNTKAPLLTSSNALPNRLKPVILRESVTQPKNYRSLSNPRISRHGTAMNANISRAAMTAPFVGINTDELIFTSNSIHIIHRSPIRVYYATRAEADIDGYNFTEVCGHLITPWSQVSLLAVMLRKTLAVICIPIFYVESDGIG
jgi:hypothetical protein